MIKIITVVRVEQICSSECWSIGHMVNLWVHIRYVTDFIQDVVVSPAYSKYSNVPEREK